MEGVDSRVEKMLNESRIEKSKKIWRKIKSGVT